MTAVTSLVELLWARFATPVLLGLAAVLLLLGLGEPNGPEPWCDEAHVTVMARNWESRGHLTGWNGRNLYGYLNGGALDQQLRPVNPPLDIWITGMAYKVETWLRPGLPGHSLWASRLPFALLGWVSLALFAALLREELPDVPAVGAEVGPADEPSPRNNAAARTWMFASLALSTAFLLYCRQCRYYSPSVAATLLTLLAWRKTAHDRRWRWPVLLAASSIVHFYANPMSCAAIAVAVGVAHLVFRRKDRPRAEWLGLLAAAWGFLMMTVPYAIYFRIWSRPDHQWKDNPWYLAKPILLYRNFREALWSSPLPWTFALLAGWCAMAPATRSTLTGRMARQWGLLAFTYMFVLSLVSPQPTDFLWPADIRYHVAILPTLAALAGAGLWALSRRGMAGRVAACAAFALMLCTNIPGLPLGPLQFQWRMPAFVAEITHPYPTATSEAADFLLASAKPDDTVWAYPDYMNYPLEWRAGHVILSAGILDRDLTHLTSAATAMLPERLWADRGAPDWLVVFGFGADGDNLKRTIERVSRYADVAATTAGAVAILNYDVAFQGRRYAVHERHRPELTDHWFGPPEEFRGTAQAVTILRRLGPKRAVAEWAPAFKPWPKKAPAQ